MRIKKVLIVAKKSAYQSYFQEYKNSAIQKLAESGDRSLLRIRRSHDTHYETLSVIREVLKKNKISFDLRFRSRLLKTEGYDLVISAGGDGTFLDAAHAVGRRPLLGVNSDINHSVGNFCAAEASNFEKILTEILSGYFKFRKLARFQPFLNGKRIFSPVLNDILVCHASPAAMSHYELQVGSFREKQRSSGLWISTASGSSGAIHSAGGKKLPPLSESLQYLPREIFEGHGIRCRLRGGLLKRGKKFSVVSQMQEGMIYMDGAHNHLPFEYGQRLEVRPAAPLVTVQARSSKFNHGKIRF